MAIRERAGRKSPWQVYWNNPITGKRESENFLTKKEAEKHDSLIKHRIKFDRESFKKVENGATADTGNEHNAMTLEAAYLMYLKQKQFNKKSLGWQMDGMRWILSNIGTVAIQDVTKNDIEKLMESMLKTSVKPVTVRGRFSVLRTVLRWCVDKEYRAPINFPKLPSAHYEKFIPPSTEELQTILSVASPHIVRAIILGAQCGVRVGPSELLRLTWNDVDIERRILRVHGAQKNINAPWREVPIRESLADLFDEWRHEDIQCGAINLIHYRGKPVKDIKTAWKLTLHRAGIIRRIRLYDLRHSFATELIAAGADVGTVAKLMGHSSPSMILSHYQYVMDRQKRSAIECLPELGHVPKNMCPKDKAATDVQ